ncbi:MAG TPA: FIST N-terminal domain-containing protein [bacterium]
MPNVNVGVGISREADTDVAVRNALQAALEQANLERAPWAFCFFTSAHLSHADVIRETILEQAGCQALCGCSAVGVLGRGEEIERGPGVVVMVGASPSLAAMSQILPHDGAGLGQLAAVDEMRGETRALIVLPDSFRVDNTALRDRLESEVPATQVVGAGATDDGTLGISLQVGMEGVRSSSIALMGLSGKMEMAVGITQSCQAVGEPHFITQAKDFVLVELDGRPALHSFIDQGRALGIEDFQQAANQLLFGFPLDSQQPKFTGEACMVRPLAGFDQASHGLVVPYPFKPQSTMGFMHRNPETAERDMSRMVNTVAGQLSGAPDFGIYFDCAARGKGLYGRPDVDVQAIHKRLGDFPLIGMFGGFEVATALGIPQVYTYTGVLVLFRVAG